MGLNLKAQNVIYSRAIAHLQDCYFFGFIKNNRIFQLFLFLNCFSRRTDLETTSHPKNRKGNDQKKQNTTYLPKYYYKKLDL